MEKSTYKPLDRWNRKKPLHQRRRKDSQVLEEEVNMNKKDLEKYRKLEMSSLPKISLVEIQELEASGHIVSCYSRKGIVVVDGFKRYKL